MLNTQLTRRASVAAALSLCAGACLSALPGCSVAEPSGQGSQGQSSQGQDPQGQGSQGQAADQPSSGPSAQDIVDSLDIEACIEQLIMPAFRTWGDAKVTALNDELAAHIAAHNYAGIILFAENFSTTEQSVALVDQIRAASAQGAGNLAPLIATDQEGGTVTRIAGTNMPGNMALAATGDTGNARTVGQIFARELGALGINVDFAPSLDTNSNPANPVIGVRSFSDDPATAATFGTAFIEGLHDGGIAASVKHFPGHGDTSTDSHTGLPLVNKTYEELAACELVPFKAGIAAGADLVMTAHIQFPLVEQGTYLGADGQEIALPATLSKTILTDILRGDLGYDGVVVTDALGMGAIKDHFDPLDAAVLALNAGVDILLMPVSVEDAAGLDELQAYIDAIVAQVGTGSDATIAEETVRAAARRVVQMKINRGLLDAAPDTRSLDEKTADALVVVGSEEHRAAERQIADAAATVVSNAGGVLPLAPQAGEHVLLVSSYNSRMDALTYGFGRLQAEGAVDAQATFEVVTYDPDNEGSVEQVVDAIGRSNYVVCLSQLYGIGDLGGEGTMSGRAERIAGACDDMGVPVAIVSCGLPYDAARFAERAMVLVYGGKPVVLDDNGNPVGAAGPNIPAGLDVVFGKVAQPSGSLPVDIPALDEAYGLTDQVLYARGFGLHDLAASTG